MYKSWKIKTLDDVTNIVNSKNTTCSLWFWWRRTKHSTDCFIKNFKMRKLKKYIYQKLKINLASIQLESGQNTPNI